MFLLPSPSIASRHYKLPFFSFAILLSHLKDTSTTSPAYLNRAFVLTKADYDYNPYDSKWSLRPPIKPLGILAFKIGLTAFTLENGQPVPPPDFRAAFIAKNLLDPDTFNAFFKNPSTTTLAAVELKGSPGSPTTSSKVVPALLKVDVFRSNEEAPLWKMSALLDLPDLQVTDGAKVFAPEVLLMISGETREDGSYEYLVTKGRDVNISYVGFKDGQSVVPAGKRKAQTNIYFPGTNIIDNCVASIVVITDSGNKAEQYAVASVLSTTNENYELTDEEFRRGTENIADFVDSCPVVGEPWHRVPWKLRLFIGVLMVGVIVLLSAIFLLLRKKTTNK